MHRAAIFVDAGYLFHHGGVALAGARQERSDLLLDVPSVVSELKFLAEARSPGCSLLRIYWYDAALAGARLTPDQALLTNADDVKVRLSPPDGLGSSRGCAAAIVSDMVELSCHKSLCEAIIFSGDEDLRVGVQIVQSHGVRVHLIGIGAGRGLQSTPLTQEADTNMEWPREVLQRFLTVRRAALQEGSFFSAYRGMALIDPHAWEPLLEHAAREFAEGLEDSDLDALEAYWATSRGVPSELDRRLLPFARGALGRDLDQLEKRFVRSSFQKNVMNRFEEDADGVE